MAISTVIVSYKLAIEYLMLLLSILFKENGKRERE